MKNIYVLLIYFFIFSTSASEQTCAEGVESYTPSSRFIINADNTVTDKQTGLIWRRCTNGQTGKNCSEGKAKNYFWRGAVTEDIAQNYKGWRLPTINELTSIIEFQCVSPAINLAIFPNTQAATYSSSSYYMNFLSRKREVWGVYFKWGGAHGSSGGHFIRLVKDK